MYRVGFWFRVLALLIDLAIFLPLAIVPCLLFGASAQLTNLVLLCGWLLYSTFEKFSVGTPGKQLLGMEIANANGSEASFWTLSLRWSSKQMPIFFGAVYVLTQYPLLYPLPGLANSLVCVGCLYASTEFRQTWHDEWAHTAVIRRPKASKRRGFAVMHGTPPPLPVRAMDEGERGRLK